MSKRYQLSRITQDKNSRLANLLQYRWVAAVCEAELLALLIRELGEDSLEVGFLFEEPNDGVLLDLEECLVGCDGEQVLRCWPNLCAHVLNHASCGYTIW